MGLFSGFSNMCGWIGDKINKAKDYIKEKVSNIKEKVSNLYSAFTGEDVAKQAKEKYGQVRRKYEEHIQRFESSVDDIAKSVNEKIDSINKLKLYYFDTLLMRYKEALVKIKGLDIESTELLDGSFSYVYKHDAMKSKQEIIKIDFDEHRIKNNVKAILTLGFLTRKQAKESLAEAEAYERSVDECISKMKGELTKLKQFESSVQNVLDYFQAIVDAAEKCVDRLRHSLNLLKNMHLAFSYSVVNGKYDITRLSKAQIRTFMIGNNLMRILLEMSKKRYINENGDEVVGHDLKLAENYAAEVAKLPIAV